MLSRNQLIGDELASNLKAMVGFRNIAVHDYRAIQVEIVQSIIDNHLEDFRTFTDIAQRI